MRNTCTLIHQTIRIPAEIDPSTFKIMFFYLFMFLHSARGYLPPGWTPIPIFIIVNDRLCVLRETLRAFYQNLLTPFEIIIHDTGRYF